MTIKVQKTHELATFEKAHSDDIGYDLTACGFEIKPEYSNLVVVDLGIKVCPPDGYYFKVYPRSSFAKKGFILAHSVGLIDPGYRGVWIFPLRHMELMPAFDTYLESLASRLIGTRIAQAELCKSPPCFQTEFVEEVSVDTDRGTGGFGSTGKHYI